MLTNTSSRNGSGFGKASINTAVPVCERNETQLITLIFDVMYAML